MKVFIIAEAGVNHNGSVKTAMKLVDAAVSAGADAVKFQTFRAEDTVTGYAPKAAYQRSVTDRRESQFMMIRRLELDESGHREIIRYCRARGIMFLSSPFDLRSIHLLAGLGVRMFKIPSGEITNLPYLRQIGKMRRRIIMSTGMSDIPEIKRALDILIGSGMKKKDIVLLHCTTQYPAPYRDVNLLAMRTIKERLGVEVGYSDHTAGIEVPIAAAALGASVIEKHLTLDKKMPGPDHKVSLEPGEFRSMVTAIRNIEKALGTFSKRPAASEAPNRKIVRKSIVAARDIIKGENFTALNLTVKRPGTGLSPMKWDRVIGRKAVRDFRKDEMVVL